MLLLKIIYVVTVIWTMTEIVCLVYKGKKEIDQLISGMDLPEKHFSFMQLMGFARFGLFFLLISIVPVINVLLAYVFLSEGDKIVEISIDRAMKKLDEKGSS